MVRVARVVKGQTLVSEPPVVAYPLLLVDDERVQTNGTEPCAELESVMTSADCRGKYKSTGQSIERQRGAHR